MLVAIVGDLGSGKTLTQTFLLFKSHLQGRLIYANYRLLFPFRYVHSIEDIDTMKAGTFGGDELWSWLDSRSSKLERNKIIASILLKSRKRDVDIYYTAQTFMQMDKRIRNITDFVIFPRLNRTETFCRAYWYARADLQFSQAKPVKLTKFPTQDIFPLYDTTEEVELIKDE